MSQNVKENQSGNRSCIQVVLLVGFTIFYLIAFLNLKTISQGIRFNTNALANNIPSGLPNKTTDDNKIINKMMFLIITVPKSKNPISMSRYFVNDLNQMPGYKALYLEWKDFNKTTQENREDILHLKAPDFYDKVVANVRPYGEYDFKSIDIFRKTYFGLSYFYYETNYRWLHRATDDNGINIKLLESFYQSLENKYDPLTQPVILGCCIKKYYTPGYLQGGAGYLYSRKAVELMLPMYKDVIYKCRSAEDICHDDFIFGLNLTIVDATSFNFLGHSFGKADLDRIYKGDFHDLSPCPKEKNPINLRHCGIFNGPANKIIFLHHHADGGINQTIERCQKIFGINDDTVHYYFPDLLYPRLCRRNKNE